MSGVEVLGDDGVLTESTGEEGSESDEMESESTCGIGGGLLGGEKKSSACPTGGGKYNSEIMLSFSDLGLLTARLEAPAEDLEERDDTERLLSRICAACLSKDSSLDRIA
jgi:hypothetical protein